MIRLLCILLGYVFGLFQTAYFYGKLKGIDIRTKGSGNAGTTNTLRVLGTKAGFIVLIGDIAKTVIAIALTRWLIVPGHEELEYLLVIYTAAGAILGHNYPFYMQFKGGKGIAATAGLLFSFHPLLAVTGVCVFLLIFNITHYVSLGSLTVYVVFLSQLIYLGQTLGLGRIEQGTLNEMYVITFLLMVMAFWKHRENIVRLVKKEERKTYLFKKNK
ncbi:MAG: glycerol-3-phosphate 1-O-acyltransferase PlsY [Lachnospiraceae bacterium]|nr:glycerol-3-phosphate 1-O-acyltransferase PlsY [Lachnospiraceae bacterium]